MSSLRHFRDLKQIFHLLLFRIFFLFPLTFECYIFTRVSVREYTISVSCGLANQQEILKNSIVQNVYLSLSPV